MRLVTLSDIHIRNLGDEGHKCLEAFFSNPLVKESTHIGLLGDIFDLMAGDHQDYLDRWSPIFDEWEKLCKSGKIIFFAEGNHDMHLESLFKRLSKGWGLEAAHRLQVLYTERVIEIEGRKVLIGHGDEYNQEDVTYLKYKKFIKRPALAFVADHVMPLAILDYVGQRASKKSRSYGERKYNEEEVKNKFRIGVEKMTSPDVDIVIGGHSHVVDEWKFANTLYLNNGYPPKSRKFIVVDKDGARLASL